MREEEATKSADYIPVLYDVRLTSTEEDLSFNSSLSIAGGSLFVPVFINDLFAGRINLPVLHSFLGDFLGASFSSCSLALALSLFFFAILFSIVILFVIFIFTHFFPFFFQFSSHRPFASVIRRLLDSDFAP